MTRTMVTLREGMADAVSAGRIDEAQAGCCPFAVVLDGMTKGNALAIDLADLGMLHPGPTGELALRYVIHSANCFSGSASNCCIFCFFGETLT